MASIIVAILALLLIASGLFDIIPWTFNIPAIVILLVLWLAVSYNRFVTLINRAKEAWADIDVQLKRRYDLIPNLVHTVKGYAAHEKGLFEEVTKARSQAMSATNVHDKLEKENMLSST